MKNYFKIIILLLTIPFLSACGSSGYAITYDTSPKGVPVICNGVNKGYSPVTLYYDFDKGENYVKTQPCYAQWEQGSEYKEFFANYWYLGEFPNGVRQTLDVPVAKSSYSSSNSSSSSSNTSSTSYKYDTPSYNSNSNSSSGYKSYFGNTYQYDLSNPVDRVKYNSDPLAKLRDRVGGNKYQRELESNLGQSGGGIFNNNNIPSWNNIPTIQPFSGFGGFSTFGQ